MNVVVVKAPHVRVARHENTTICRLTYSRYATRCMLEDGAHLAYQIHHAMTADETEQLLAYHHSIGGMLKEVASFNDIHIAESNVKPLMTEILSFCKDFSDLATVLTAQPKSCDGVAERYYIRKTVIDDAVRVIIRIDAELV